MFVARRFLGKSNYNANQNSRRKRKSKTIIYDSDESVKSALLEILVYIVFLIATTIVANAAHHLYMFYFNQTLEKLFIEGEIEINFGITTRFEEMVTTADWWSFLENKFLNDLHGLPDNGNLQSNDSDTDTEMNNTNRIIMRDNMLLGTPRLRQIRVKDNSCHVNEAFVRYFNTCYSEYTRGVEETRSVFKNTSFYSMSELNVNSIRAEIKRYYGAGYISNLAYDRQTNENILKELKDAKWIDRGTRIVLLEFVIFNSNSLLFDNIKIFAEMPPVGGIITSYHFQSLKLHSIWTDDDYVVFVIAILFYGMVVFYTFEEIGDLHQFGILQYAKGLWNLVDVAVLILSYFSFVYNIIHPIYLRKILEKSIDDPFEFASIDQICFWNTIYIDIMGVCVFLVWIKIFKYISFNKTMLQFSTTLNRCAKDLFGFAFMFFIVFLAYAQLGLLIFGTNHPDFREFDISIITLMRMFLGDFEYQLIEEANHILGPIYFLTYVLFVFFILLNMFLAIINDTYGVVKAEVSQGRSYFGSYLTKLFQNLCFRKRNETEIISQNETSQQSSEAKEQVDSNTLGILIETERNSVSTTSLYPTSNISSHEENDHLRMRVSELIKDYFEELPATENKLPDSPQHSKDSYDLGSLTNRITLLEEVLEQLITEMDRILSKIETKQRSNTRKGRKL